MEARERESQNLPIAWSVSTLSLGLASAARLTVASDAVRAVDVTLVVFAAASGRCVAVSRASGGAESLLDATALAALATYAWQLNEGCVRWRGRAAGHTQGQVGGASSDLFFPPRPTVSRLAVGMRAAGSVRSLLRV